MTWQVITKLVQSIINSIESTAVSSVQSLHKTITSHTYQVQVKNPVEKVSVRGSVIVENQQDVEGQIKKLITSVESLKKALQPKSTIKIDNFPKPIEFPKEFKISNLKDKTEVTNLNVVISALGQIEKEVKKIKLDPKITVEPVKLPSIPAPIINIPEQKPPIVQVTEKTIDVSALKELLAFFENLSSKNPLPARLTDGKTFYKALDKLGDMFAANNEPPFQNKNNDSVRPVVNKQAELQVTASETWEINDIDRPSTTITYYGEETIDGKWRIRRIIIDGTLTSIRHANVNNNAGFLGYQEAWENRLSLQYNYANGEGGEEDTVGGNRLLENGTDKRLLENGDLRLLQG